MPVVENSGQEKARSERKDFSFFVILWTSTLVFLLILWGVKLLTTQWKPQRPLPLQQEKMLTEVFLRAAQTLQERWEWGDVEENFARGKFQCPREIEYSPQTDDQFLRCNPNYLQCYFDGKTGTPNPEIKINVQGKTFTVLPKRDFPRMARYSPQERFYTVVSRSQGAGANVPAYGIMMRLSLKEFPLYSMTVVLEDNCHDTYLPQRIYAYGSMNFPKTKDKEELPDWIWDNFHRDIYVDKFLVTFRDLIEWLDYGTLKPSTAIFIPPHPKDWAQPATGLVREDMQRFCAFRGKQLMEAPVFDAASFYPADLENPRPPQVVRGPYPWNRKTKLLAPATLSPTPALCRRIYARECRKLMPQDHHSSHGPTWVEMNQVLGGTMEAMQNPLFPRENLKASSFYFPLKSFWHQLGLRAYWDGRGFGRDHFDWNPLEERAEDDPPWKIGFRCMTFSEGEEEG